jgi:hypothetical protein
LAVKRVSLSIDLIMTWHGSRSFWKLPSEISTVPQNHSALSGDFWRQIRGHAVSRSSWRPEPHLSLYHSQRRSADHDLNSQRETPSTASLPHPPCHGVCQKTVSPTRATLFFSNPFWCVFGTEPYVVPYLCLICLLLSSPLQMIL